MQDNIRQQIEACRPGSDDLQLPEMAAAAEQVRRDPAVSDIYEQTQAWDALVAEAFADVPVPDGLQERLLARLAEEAPESQEIAITIGATAPAERAGTVDRAGTIDRAAKPAAGKQVVTGKTLALAAGAVAIGLALLLLVALIPNRQPLDEQQILEMVQASPVATNWNEDFSLAPHPFSDDVAAVPEGWQYAADLPDRQAIVFNLGPRATLHVFAPAAPVQGLPLSPPQSPQSSSGKIAGAWTSGGLVYVLSVEGRRERYQSFIKGGGGLASAPQFFATLPDA